MSTFCLWFDTPTRPRSSVREDSVSLTGFPRRPSRAQPADCVPFSVSGFWFPLWFPTLSYPFLSPPAPRSQKISLRGRVVCVATFTFRRLGIMNRKLASSTAVNPPPVFHVSHFCSTVAGSPQGCNHAPIVALSLSFLLPYHGTLLLTCLPTKS